MTMLTPGDTFPALIPRQPGGASYTVPGDFEGGYGVVLHYRGSWCPYCNAQLRAFQRATGSHSYSSSDIGDRVQMPARNPDAARATCPPSGSIWPTPENPVLEHDEQMRRQRAAAAQPGTKQ